VVVIAGVAAGFELLNRNMLAEFSVTGAKFTDVDFLRTLAPAVVAYLLLRFAVLARELGINHSVFSHLTCQYFYGLHGSEIDRVLAVVGGPAVSRPPPAFTPKGRLLGDSAMTVQTIISVVAPCVFIVYAFCQLLMKSPANILTWLAMAATLVCLFFTAGFVVMTWHVDRWSFAREFDYHPLLMALVRRMR
jgi:hypothetical protein